MKIVQSSPSSGSFPWWYCYLTRAQYQAQKLTLIQSIRAFSDFASFICAYLCVCVCVCVNSSMQFYHMCACVHAKSPQSCQALCDPMDCSLPGSSIHRILQARIPDWVARPTSRITCVCLCIIIPP